jgi:hypothetical protein
MVRCTVYAEWCARNSARLGGGLDSLGICLVVCFVMTSNSRRVDGEGTWAKSLWRTTWFESWIQSNRGMISCCRGDKTA